MRRRIKTRGRPLKINEVLIGTKMVATMLGCSERTIGNWVRAGTFPPGKLIGKRHKWTVSTVQKWLDRTVDEAEGKTVT